jgi:hypothetical protein
MPTRKYATKSRGRPFALGNSGKPKGARHKTTLAVESLLDGEAEKLTRKAIKLALAGDTTALKLCLERIAPLRRGRPVAIALPDVKSPGGVTDALAVVVAAMGDGAITTEEASAICAVIENQRRAIETEQLEARLLAIEEGLKSNDTNN